MGTRTPSLFTGPHPGIEPRQRFAGPLLLRPFCTMLDWLTVMMMGPWHTMTNRPNEPVPWRLPNLHPGIAWYRADMNVGDWRKVFYITDAVGEKLVTILADHADRKKYPQDFMTAQFANCTLANGYWRELFRALREMGCEHMGVQRIDIAADGWENIDNSEGGGEFIGVVMACLRGHGDYYGKAHWKTHHLRHEFNGFEFGSRRGNKFMRCYRKKREMKQVKHKPHIVEAWRAALNGYDPMEDPREVGRLEIVLKGKELRRYFKGESDFDALVSLHDPTTRASVFHATTRKVFDFRGLSTDGRARSASPLFAWDFSLCTTNPIETLIREQRARKLSPHRVKSALHFMYDLYLTTCDAEVLKVAERAALAAGSEFLDYMRTNERQWQALHHALTEGTARRPGAQDAFTDGYFRRLREGVVEGESDLVDKFNRGDGIEDARIIESDDDGDCDGFVF